MKTKWIKHKIILLSTNNMAKAEEITTNDTMPGMFIMSQRILNAWNDSVVKPKHLKGNHLYIISNETNLSTSDWILENNKLKLFNSKSDPNKCIKVIATTRTDIDLPKPSSEFIDLFIEEYNYDNYISDVMVEYEEKWINRLGFGAEKEESLKIKSDNTISIKIIKDTWNKEEVDAEKNDFIYLFFSKHYDKLSNIGFTSEYIRKWIKENL